MDRWIEFLRQQGARVLAGEGIGIAGFEGTQALPTASTNFMVPLTDIGLIAVAGEDAASFLHAQLTNDVTHLSASQARLAGYCTPKGRLLATVLLWKIGDDILVQAPLELLSGLQKRLQMFVLRAKAKLSDVTSAWVQIGLVGPAASASLANWFPDLPAMPYAKVESSAGILLRLADAAHSSEGMQGQARYVWILTAEAAQAAWPRLAKALQPAGTNAWRLAEIRAAVASVTLATQEKFVPQMVNFEAVGGVNFQKGCYPGQEIVARSQYLGKLKRRMVPATVESAEVRPGMEVFSSLDGEQPCGMIVNAAPIDERLSACLVEMKLSALDADVRLGAGPGPRLLFHALPYALADSERPEPR
ncbi:MAG: folate-binding protein YgfZ [Burkholderiaceae bacterium]